MTATITVTVIVSLSFFLLILWEYYRIKRDYGRPIFLDEDFTSLTVSRLCSKAACVAAAPSEIYIPQGYVIPVSSTYALSFLFPYVVTTYKPKRKGLILWGSSPWEVIQEIRSDYFDDDDDNNLRPHAVACCNPA